MALYSDSPTAQILVLFVLSLFVVADLVGNILVCLVVHKNPRMRTPMNIILFNLAICDITVAMGMTSKYIITKFFQHPTGDCGRYLCTFITSGNLTWVGGLASVFCLVSLAYERYSAIVNPINIHKRTSKTSAKILCIIAWITSIMICIPEFFGHQYSKEREVCYQRWPADEWLPQAYSMFWLFIVGFIPSTLLVFYYSRIVRSLWFAEHPSQEAHAQMAALRYRKSVTKMLIGISVIYMIGWMPTLFVFVLVYWHTGYQVGQVIGAVTAILVVFNSAVNPYVYALQSKSFRKQLKRYLVCCCQCQYEVQPISSLAAVKSGRQLFPNMAYGAHSNAAVEVVELQNVRKRSEEGNLSKAA
ncbi:predicted protein [Nematostella vectensis]|uniref:G-protein coupled receptors family 1 profile domain-containing protein n=1 Tax=Nematostella vectensis TaxID=45351 RepID=A7SMQ7_NEMVE|nr:tachykinin-like peptides receptor 86C [Nematostella vectensis]XP_048576267.1 tachykinin-like peptides receptor 86C [Nematostella vectensis]EDO35030.1 predicted protein [Nematostella vectensis]|eukprot:XP_001627130.1 predicted protein [Nematostella vectensis]